MPIRKHKRYSRPRKLYDIAIMKEEQGFIKKYGLKSRREVWKADFLIGNIRDQAKKLIAASEDKKQAFIKRQADKGFNVSTIADILALNKEDRLKRMLQSIIVAKGFAKTPKQARQMITHKHVRVNGIIISSPRHLTTLAEENGIEVDLVLPEKKVISDAEKDILKKMHHESGSTKEEKAEEAGAE
jgi:small subunit ribosomal protein S4